MCGRLAVIRLAREQAVGLTPCAPSRKERSNEHKLARGHAPANGRARPADADGRAQPADARAREFGYTFEHIADVTDRLTEVLGLDRFALYVFGYGAPVGFRIATRHPERITAIIPRNGNAYTEGLSDGWNPVQAHWKDPSEATREAIRMFLEPPTIWQYTHGVPDTVRVSPDGYGLDNYYLARSGADEIQLDLFLDYASNVALYPAFQERFPGWLSKPRSTAARPAAPPAAEIS